MKRSASFLALIFAAAGASLLGTVAAANDAVRGVETQPIIGAKLRMEKKIVSLTDERITITYVIVDPTINRLHLAIPRNPMGGGSSLWDFLRDESVHAAFTGGYLSAYTPASPAGFLKHKGTLVNEIDSDQVLSGVVCFEPPADSAGVLLTTITNHDVFNQWGSCFQAGPTLVLQGKIADDLAAIEASIAKRPTERKSPLTTGHYERAFIVKTRQGALILGITTPASLYAIRSIALLEATKGGFEAEAAITLTGWRTAGLVVVGAKPEGTPSTLLPNAIVVEASK